MCDTKKSVSSCANERNRGARSRDRWRGWTWPQCTCTMRLLAHTGSRGAAALARCMCVRVMCMQQRCWQAHAPRSATRLQVHALHLALRCGGHLLPAPHAAHRSPVSWVLAQPQFVLFLCALIAAALPCHRRGRCCSGFHASSKRRAACLSSALQAQSDSLTLLAAVVSAEDCKRLHMESGAVWRDVAYGFAMQVLLSTSTCLARKIQVLHRRWWAPV